MLTQIIFAIAILIVSYLLSHIARFISKKNFCAKCSSLIISLVVFVMLDFPIEITSISLGALIAILSYYADDYLINKKKINLLTQDFLILLLLLIIGMIILNFL